jgi:CRP-like cAMP-binding protein
MSWVKIRNLSTASASFKQFSQFSSDSASSKELEDFLVDKVLHYEIDEPEERRACATLLSRKLFNKAIYKKGGTLHTPSNQRSNTELIVIIHGSVHAKSVAVNGIQRIETTFNALHCIGVQSLVSNFPLTLSYPGGEISQSLVATEGTTVFIAKKETRRKIYGMAGPSLSVPKKSENNSFGRTKTVNYKDAVALLRRSLEKFAEKELVHFVEKLPFLGNLDEAKRHEIARCLVDHLKFVVKEQGEYIYKRGELGTSMFFVWSGSIAVSVEEKLVADFRVGSFFGERAVLLQDHIREADARASSRCVLLVLPGEAVPRLKEISPEQIDSSFGLSIRIHTGQILQNLNMTLLSGFDSTRISLMMHFFDVSEFKADSVVYTKGASCDLFRVITSGQVECTFKDRTWFKNPGEYFGEIFNLVGNDHKRATTVRTTTNCTFLECSYTNLERFCALEPQIKAEFELKLYGFGCTIDSVLNHQFSRHLLGEHLQKERATENIHFWMAVESLKREDKFMLQDKLMLESAGSAVVVFENGDDSAIKRDKNDAIPQSNTWTLKSIYENFIADSGDEQVNIAGKLRKRIDEAYSKGKLELPLMVEARDEIVRLMGRDNFARFKKSDRMEMLMERIKPYDDDFRKEVCSQRAQKVFRKAYKTVLNINLMKQLGKVKESGAGSAGDTELGHHVVSEEKPTGNTSKRNKSNRRISLGIGNGHHAVSEEKTTENTSKRNKSNRKISAARTYME